MKGEVVGLRRRRDFSKMEETLVDDCSSHFLVRSQEKNNQCSIRVRAVTQSRNTDGGRTGPAPREIGEDNKKIKSNG